MSDELDAFLPDLRRFALSLTGCSHLADEVAQETLLRALQRNQTDLPPIEKPKAWLFQIAANLYRERWRREGRRAEVEATAARDPFSPAGQTPTEIASHREHLEQVWKFVEELPDLQRQVLLLNVWERLSHAEIATRLGMSLGSVKTSLSIARRKLRKHFYPGQEGKK